MFDGGNNNTAGKKRLAAALRPMDAAIAHKFIHTLPVAEGPQRSNGHHIVTRDETPTTTFQPGTELLYGGQGKITSTNNLIQLNDIRESEANNIPPDYGGLAEPRLDDTDKEVTGDAKGLLCKQNKKQKQRQKAAQIQQSQWTVHTGQVSNNNTPIPRTREQYRNKMCPTGRAVHHPAFRILRDWATYGCPM